LCESPLTFEALTVWRDELNEGKVLLRDIIDLEAMYGAGPDGQPANVPPPVGPDGQPLNPPINGAAPPAPMEFKKPVPPPPRPYRRRPSLPPPQGGRRRRHRRRSRRAADDGDDFDDEGNLPLSAMEAALKPQVLASLGCHRRPLQEAGKLQDASVEAALASDELSTGQERRFKKLRNEDHGFGQVAQAQQQPHRSPGRPDVRHQSPPGGPGRQAVALAESHGVDRAEFLKHISAMSSTPTGRAASAA
jgi:RNA polymerase primary sigma factor